MVDHLTSRPLRIFPDGKYVTLQRGDNTYNFAWGRSGGPLYLKSAAGTQERIDAEWQWHTVRGTLDLWIARQGNQT